MPHHRPNGGVVGGTVVTSYLKTEGYGVWGLNDAAQRMQNLYALPQENWPVIPADASFSSVTCLIHCDEFSTSGSRGCLRDRSASGNHVDLNVNNGMPQVATTQTKFGAYAYFNDQVNGTIGAVNITGTTADFGFGTNDFTIECWQHPTDVTAGLVLDLRPASTNGAYPALYYQGSGDLAYYVSSANRITSGNGGVSANAWSHIAVARTGTSTKLFVNGTQVGSTYSDSTNYLSTQLRLMIGNASTGSGKGYMSEVRITKGVCRYTGNFTAPTTRFPDY